MVKNNRITAYSGIVLELGKVGENGAVKIVFPAEKIFEEYGEGGSFRILNQWPDGDLAYPVQAELQGSNVIWTVSGNDVPCAGTGCCELQYIKGDRIVKSETWKTRTLASLGEYDEAPEAAQRWQEEILKAAARAEKAEQAVESARKDAAGSAGRARTAAEQAAENSERATQSARNAQEQATLALVAAGNAETAAAAAEEKAEQAADDAAAAKTKTDAIESTVRGLSMTSSQLVSGMQSVWEQLAQDEGRLEAVEQTAAGKQDKLTAGANITISGNVISASGGGGGSYDDTELRNRIGSIEDDLSELPGILSGYNDRLLDHESRIQELEDGGGGGSYDDTELRQRIGAIEGKEAGWDGKQDKLTAGTAIKISGNAISAERVTFTAKNPASTSPTTYDELLEHFNAGEKLFGTRSGSSAMGGGSRYMPLTFAVTTGDDPMFVFTSYSYENGDIRAIYAVCRPSGWTHGVLYPLVKVNGKTASNGEITLTSGDISGAVTETKVNELIDAKLAAIPYAEGVGF